MFVKNTIFSVIFILFALPVMAAMPEIAETISTGSGPTSIAVDEKGDRVFVANAFDNNVAVIGTVEATVKGGKKEKKHKLIKKIPTKARALDINMGANGLVYDEITDRLYLPDLDHSFIILDAKNYKLVKSVPNAKGENGWTSAVHLDRGTRELVVLDWYGFMQVYDDLGKKKREADTGLRGIKYYAITKDGLDMYITKGQEMVRLGVRGGKEKNRISINVNSIPVMDDATGYVYVGGEGKIYKMSDREVVGEVNIGFPGLMGFGMAINPDTGHLFAPSGEDSVAIININTMELIGKLKVGNSPRSIAVNTKTNMVYVACSQGGKVVVIKDQK